MENKRSHSVPEILEYDCSPHLPRKQPPVALNPLSDLSKPSLDSKPSAKHGRDKKERRWPTPWYWQFLVLTVRTFRQSRHVILSPYNFVQTLLIAAVVSLLWFQVPLEEESISDRYGAVSVPDLTTGGVAVRSSSLLTDFLHLHLLVLHPTLCCCHLM